MISLLLVVDRHKLTVFYLKSFDMDSVQVGKAVLGKEIHTTLGIEPMLWCGSSCAQFGTKYILSCDYIKYILNPIKQKVFWYSCQVSMISV